MEMSQGSRIYQTLLVMLVAAIEGAFTGILGPTLPALQCLFSTDLHTISTIFFIFGLMNAMGSIISCLLLQRFNIILVLVFVIPLASVTELIFPFSTDVSAAILIAGVTATLIGVMFNCRIGRCSELWPSQPAALHVVIGGYALGAVFSSLIATPFLYNVNQPPQPQIYNNVTGNTTADTCSTNGDIVRYVFIILGCLGFPLAFAFLVTYINQRRNAEYNEPSSCYTPITPLPPHATYGRRGYIPFVIFFFLLCLPAGGIFIIYGSLFTTYGLQSDAHFVSEQDMALLTAVYWATFVSGRLIMAGFSGCFKQIWIIIFGYCGLFASTVLLMLYNSSVTSLAISTSLFGFFCAPFSALTFSWSSQYIKLTEFVIALGSVGEYTGAMTGPYIGGLLMASYGPDAFLYVILGTVVLQFSFFCVLYLISKYVLEKEETDEQGVLKHSENVVINGGSDSLNVYKSIAEFNR